MRLACWGAYLSELGRGWSGGVLCGKLKGRDRVLYILVYWYGIVGNCRQDLCIGSHYYTVGENVRFVSFKYDLSPTSSIAPL